MCSAKPLIPTYFLRIYLSLRKVEMAAHIASTIKKVTGWLLHVIF